MFSRIFLSFLLLFSAIGPFLVGKPVQAQTLSSPISLGFTPHDTVIDTNKSVVYMTKLGSKTLYAVNFLTGEIKTLTLPYPAERLDLQNNKLYITQHKMSHDSYSDGPYTGAIAQVDTETFTLGTVLDINEDPFDIAVDQNDYIYISPGSGQWGNLKVYSMKDQKEITQNTGKTQMYERSYIFYNVEMSKVYAVDTTISPRDIDAFEVSNGIIQNHYDSPYHGDYPLETFAKISPEGGSFYSTSGHVFELAAYQSGDMKHQLTFGKGYNDFEFSLEHQLTFAASTTYGIHVYQYGTTNFLYSLRDDLQVQKLHLQNDILVVISKNNDGQYFLETMNADTPPTNGLPETPGVPDPAGSLSNLGFKPYDTAIDPNKPVVYMTRPGSKTIYASDLSTGEIKALALPYPAERLELYNNKLYVTQHKMAHQYSTSTPLIGGIAEVDTETFTATKLFHVDTDPYDIAIDANGYIYISPGSNQWENLKVYSLATGGEVTNSSNTTLWMSANLYYSPEVSKVYAASPNGLEAFAVDHGKINAQYRSPYHGYPLELFMKISPDGLSMYNNSGVVTKLASNQSGDMAFAFKLPRVYSDYEFSMLKPVTFAGRADGGIDVYQEYSNEYLYTIRKDLKVQKLHYLDGQLVVVGKDDQGMYFVEMVDENTEGVQDPPADPKPPTDPEPAKEIELLDTATLVWDLEAGDFIFYDGFYDGMEDVPLYSLFGFQFDQMIDSIDDTNIILEGPEGKVETYSDAYEDVLYVMPDILNGETTYTLTIKKEALTGSDGQHAASDIVIHFTTASNWENYDGIWYYYDPSIGDYVTGWQDIDGSRYYFNEYGEMQTGWEKINSVWYYFNSDGTMKTGWLYDAGKWYYLTATGAMKTGWLYDAGKWYYLTGSGAMKTGWLLEVGKWYYLTGSGAMKTGWLLDGGKWYYLTGSGAMKTGWLQLGNTWYYLTGSGAMKTGWLQLGNHWYYFFSRGAMAANTKVGNYRFNASGQWIR